MTQEQIEFIKYVTKFGKTYTSKEEYEFRAAVFNQAREIIAQKNSRNGATYSLGVNKFADWTREEYRAILGYKTRFSGEAPKTFAEGELPKKLDWRDQNAVNDVQDQGQCGSCWAFSAVAAIEGHHAIKTGKLLKLSEQQLVDCADGVYGNEGCDGGDMGQAMNYTITHPLETEDDYPYTEFDGDCEAKGTDPKGKVSATQILPVTPRNVTQLLLAIAQGPVSAAIEADSDDFQYYQWGILNGAGCGTDLDHGVTIVGYDISDGIDDGWYIVRNSWGDQWGEQGYVRIAINEGDGTCGIQLEPVWPQTN